jgi:hypothetical protein
MKLRWVIVSALLLATAAVGISFLYMRHSSRRTSASDLLTNIMWCMWHQGAIVWDNNGNSNQLAPKSAAFWDLVQVENDGGKTMLLQAGSDTVYQMLPTAISQCVTDHRTTFVADMHWVCYTQNRIDPILKGIRSGRFEDVRQEYWKQENFDDNKSNVASCFDGTELTKVAEEACGYQP